MKCLRIVSTHVETGERIRYVRVPLFALKVGARFMPPSLLAKFDEKLTEDIARAVLAAIPDAADEIVSQPVDEATGVGGLIAEVEMRRGGRYDIFPPVPGKDTGEEWTERTLFYID